MCVLEIFKEDIKDNAFFNIKRIGATQSKMNYNIIFILLIKNAFFISNTVSLVKIGSKKSQLISPIIHQTENWFNIKGLLMKSAERESLAKKRMETMLRSLKKEHDLLILLERDREKLRIENEKKKQIYNTHLASRISGSLKNDFLTLRYKKIELLNKQ